ncbi:MAG: hypothetical protein H6926_03815 [Chromatiales bacterium]|nr:hypothetical protein [Gammaproteobacteria bacterium]MCP5230996.1 hypothetical protein [Zoogloeaceae bacterium]MCP5352303.1 hypothetical protein [Chromatiales bacterium]
MPDLSTLPVAQDAVRISREQAGVIRHVVDEVLALFKSVDLYRFSQAALAHDPVSTRILAGCVEERAPRARMASFDFHVVDDDVQLIEWSLFPAGLSFVAGELFASKHGRRYTDVLLRLFDPYDVIAVLDVTLVEQLFLPEFFWFKAALEARGKTVHIAEAADLVWNEDGREIAVAGELVATGDCYAYQRFAQPARVDFVANRLPFDDFRADVDQFAGLLEAQCKASERFLTDYFEWLISEKSSLVFLRDVPELAPYLGDARFSTEFADVAEVRKRFGQKIASKPLFSKGGRGVLIKPSNPQLQAILDDENTYVLQRYLAAPKLPNGNKYDLRVLWVEGGEPLFIARQFQGAVTNFRAVNSGHSAVEVV